MKTKDLKINGQCRLLLAYYMVSIDLQTNDFLKNLHFTNFYNFILNNSLL